MQPPCGVLLTWLILAAWPVLAATPATSTTFEVSPVEIAGEPVEHVPTGYALRTRFGRYEATSVNHEMVIHGGMHALVFATHLAYARHYPLVLSPDMLWLTILHGISLHIRQAPDSFCTLLGVGRGNQTLSLRRDDFVCGKEDNPWPEVFGAFSRMVRERMDRRMWKALAPEFSTTGELERAAYSVSLMSLMRHFFTYELVTICGIPRITLRGTPDDWRRLRENARLLDRFGLEWWHDALEPVLEQFVDASEGRIDTLFWRGMYKKNNMSGGPYIHGWIVSLFPYIVSANDTLARNPLIRPQGTPPPMPGLTTDDFPPGVAVAPFTWQYLGESHSYDAIAGLLCIRQDTTTLALEPMIGWLVCEAGRTLSPPPMQEWHHQLSMYGCYFDSLPSNDSLIDAEQPFVVIVAPVSSFAESRRMERGLHRALGTAGVADMRNWDAQSGTQTYSVRYVGGAEAFVKKLEGSRIDSVGAFVTKRVAADTVSLGLRVTGSKPGDNGGSKATRRRSYRR